MSLLLDALNRASKDKAAAAAETATPFKPADPELPMPELTIEPADLRVSSPSNAGDAGPSDAPAEMEWSLATDGFTPLRQTFKSREPAPGPAAVVAQEATSSSTRPVVAPPPTPSAQADHRPTQPPAPAAGPVASAGPSGTGQGATRIARDIVSAKAPAAPARPPRRTLVLAGVAGLLALGLAGLWFGGSGDPSAWFQTGSMGMPGAGPTVGAAVGAAGPRPVAVESPPGDPARGAPGAATPTVAAPVLARKSPATPAEPDRTPATISSAPAAKVVQAGAAAAVLAPPKVAPAPKPGLNGVQSRRAGPSALELGYAALTQGRLQDAAQAYAEALLTNPEERDALLGQAYIAQRQGRDDDARALYGQVLRQEPGNPVARAGLLGLSGRDDAQTTASRLREVAEQNPDSAAAQSALGHALVREDRLADARQAFLRATVLEPAVAQHAFNLAVALDRLHDYANARHYYDRALSLSAQAGGERASGVPHAVVQSRLEQLQAAAR